MKQCCICKLLPMMMALSCILSCSDNILEKSRRIKEVNLIAELEESSSRTQIDDIQHNGPINILWSVGDKLGVFGNTTINAEFTGSYTEPVSTANFSGTINSNDSPKYVYYPYREEATDMTKIPVTIDGTQYYSGPTSIANIDIKASETSTQEDNGFHFTFQSMVSMLRFKINVESVEGISTSEQLMSIHIEEEEGEELEGAKPWCGEFTMDLTKLSDGLSAVSGNSSTGLVVDLSESPISLSNEVIVYAALAPNMVKDQKLQIYLETNKNWIGFKVAVLQDFVAGACYDIPIVLAKATEENGLTIEELSSEDVEETDPPVLSSFIFEVAKNNGKLLSTEAYYDESLGKTTIRNMSDQIAIINEEEGTINLCIPYLYDFTLTPTFEVSEGATVKVNDVNQTSGIDSQDFKSPITYTVEWENGSASREYVVNITNTGLPVVVLTQDDPSASIHKTIKPYSGLSSNYVYYMNYLGTNIPCKETSFDDLLSNGTSKLSIYENGSATHSQLTCGFRLRGNSSSRFPKKPIAIKLESKANLLNIMEDGTHKRWCLLAGWTDRSMIRNAVANEIATTIKEYFTNTSETDADGYGLVWNPSGKNVELVLNGVHVGNYYLCEQIKVDDNRLALNDPECTIFADCGFLLESDDNYDEAQQFKTSNYSIPFMFKDEVDDNFVTTVQTFINDIESNLIKGNYTTAYEKLHINSLIDWWIIHELATNNEYRHPKSIYMYKNGEGKLHAGPIWDFDYQTFANITNVNANSDIEFSKYNYNNNESNKISYSYSTLLHSLKSSNDEPYMWYPLLFKDETFINRVQSRWNKLYNSLNSIVSTIQTLGAKNKVSDEYNKSIWPMNSGERYTRIVPEYSTYGENTTDTWFIDCCGDEGLQDYDNVIQTLIEAYQKRLAGMNTAINDL